MHPASGVSGPPFCGRIKKNLIKVYAGRRHSLWDRSCLRLWSRARTRRGGKSPDAMGGLFLGLQPYQRQRESQTQTWVCQLTRSDCTPNNPQLLLPACRMWLHIPDCKLSNGNYLPGVSLTSSAVSNLLYKQPAQGHQLVLGMLMLHSGVALTQLV